MFEIRANWRKFALQLILEIIYNKKVYYIYASGVWDEEKTNKSRESV